MKKNWTYVTFKSLLFLAVTLIVLSSCERKDIYFSSPQPVDGEALKRMPAKFRDKWLNNEYDTVEFGRDYYREAGYSMNKYSRDSVESSPFFTFIDNKLFIIDTLEENHVSNTFKYELVDDTFHVFSYYVNTDHLNEDFIVKKVGGYYVISDRAKTNWWYIYLLQFSGKDTIIVKQLCKAFENLDNCYTVSIPGQEGSEYIHAKWTTEYMQSMIDQGVFCDTLRVFTRLKK